MSFSPGDYSEWSLRGEGGEAEIFRARQVSLDRLVAIKRLKLTSIGNAEDIRRFEREAKLCASLIHPNLVPIFDYGSEGPYYYLVMEFVHGVDLGKIADLPAEPSRQSSADVTGGFPARAEKPALPETLKVHLARQMVEVVEFIQQKGVLHRDLKPENFMADSAARIKLLDLGMARAQFQTHTDANGDGLKGTLAYLPPEILRGQGPLDKLSEYYSLALVILELFKGSRYYRGKNSEEVVSLIQSGIPLREMPEVPQVVKTLLAPYLSTDPKTRPATLEPLLRGLKGMQGNTLAIAGGKEALHSVIRREQRAWLWAMVRASEAAGRVEEAFARLRELLEAEPDDAVGQAKFQELGMRLNDIVEPAPLPSPPPPASGGYADLQVTPRNSNPRILVLAAIAFFAAAAWGIFYFQSRPRAGDMGRDLMRREMSQLSRDESAPAAPMAPLAGAMGTKGVTPPVIAGEAALNGTRKPTLKPYGVLIVSRLPKDYRLLVNHVRYSAAGEIHLPATRHLLEIQDAGSRPVIRDSVTVGGGEPTVFDFQRRAGKQ